MVEDRKLVLLVDLDPQANLTLSLGLQPADVQRTMADVLMGSQPVMKVSRETGLPGLELAPANHELLMAQQFLTVRENYELLLREPLKTMDAYDIIILDCPPTLGPVTRLALSSADLLIIPTQCEYFSAHALRDMLNLIREVRRRTNPGLRYRLLLTMLDRRNRIHVSMYHQVRTAFGRAVFQTVIEVDTRLRESPVFSQPITNYAPRSRGANQYRALALELRQYAQETVESSTRSA